MFDNIKNINRLREILLVFFEQGFGFIIAKIGLQKFIPISKRLKFRKEQDNLPVRLRKSFEKLGPVFIKLGQFLSLRPDIIPNEYIKEFEKLQDSAPSFPYKEVKKTIEHDFGSINIMFKSFEQKPIASASVSQVHKARLKNNKTVAVKVQRPNMKKQFQKDLSLLLFISLLLEKHIKVFKRYDIVNVVNEFKRWSTDEIDFRIEASNAKILRNNFKNSKDVLIPEIFRSSEKVLIMEYVDGIPLNNVDAVKKQKKNYIKFVDSAYNATLTMIFDHGFFHADPHPANILVLKKSDKIAFIDFGITGTFDDNLKLKSLQMFDSILNGDIESLVKSLMTIGSVDPEEIDETEFKRDLRVIVNQLRFSSLKEIEVSTVLNKALDISLKHRIIFPLDFVLFTKTVVTLEGLGLRYNPNFRLVEQSKPIIKKLLKKTISPKKIISDIKTTASNYKQLIDTLPETSFEILQKVKKGKIKIDIEDTDVRNLVIEMEKSTGNLTIGLIAAALIVGSSLISQIEHQPQFIGFPLIPLLGFVFAALLSVWILHRTLFLKSVR
ncbi:hypothetical protein KY345_04575 [Candidatus Woesearchaeota archaeon]|nr:hypothetical protein [Candidatus Woesearchaeota archaeon]